MNLLNYLFLYFINLFYIFIFSSYCYCDIIIQENYQNNQNNLISHPFSSSSSISTSSTSNLKSYNIIVDSLIDSLYNISYCNQSLSLSGKCNIRNAIYFCYNQIEYENDCYIELPSNSYIIMNTDYGEIYIEDLYQHIFINGHNSIITPSKYSYSMRFLVLLVNSSNTQFSSQLNINNLTFQNFGRHGDGIEGGVIYLNGVKSSIFQNVTFIYNKASYGGAIFLDSCFNIIFKYCNFYSNSAFLEGGGMSINSKNKDIILFEVNFINNKVTNTLSMGGGIIISESNINITLNKLNLINNTAYYGGGIFLENFNQDISIFSSIISNNYAVDSGAGLYLKNRNNNILLQNNQILENIALYSAGMYSADYNSNIFIISCLMKNNIATISSSGGMFFSLGSLNIFILNSQFINNSAYTYGGSISFIYGKDIYIENCTFIKNHAINSNGGALYFNTVDYVKIIDCKFQFNNAYRSGAIYIQLSNHFLIKNSNFSNNQAIVYGGANSLELSNNITYDSCIFYQNTALEGGAFQIFNANSNIQFISCNFIQNYASSIGGAIFTDGNLDYSIIILCNFTNNIAEVSGGAMMVRYTSHILITQSIFYSNTASTGGAIYLEDSVKNFNITESIFSYNNAIYSGGSISVGHYLYTLYIIDCIFQYDNSYIGGSINIDIYNSMIFIISSTFMNSTASLGGFIYVNNYCTYLEFINCSFSNAKASYSGGILFDTENDDILFNNCKFNNNLAQIGGGSSLVFYSGSDRIKINNCYFISNHALEGGGAIIFFEKNFDILISNSYFYDNIANFGGSITFNFQNTHIVISNTSFINNYALNGAGIYLSYKNENILIDYCKFYHNIADTGTGLFIDTVNKLINIQNSTYYNNIASGSGGGIYFKDNNQIVEIVSTKFIKNMAYRYGGGLSFRTGNSFIEIEQSIFVNNTSLSSGGALHSSLFNEISITFSDFFFNIAINFGGGNYFGEDHSYIYIYKSNYYNNIGSNGGGIYISKFNDNVDLKNTIFKNNNASENGAGIYLLSDYSSFISISFINNLAYKSGGGLFFIAKNILLESCIYNYNVASNGAAIFIELSEKISIINSTFLSNYAPFSAITLSSSNFISIIQSNFKLNYGVSGGAINIQDITNITINNCIFYGNSAIFDGGALWIVNTFLFTSYNNIFENNIASSNGGSIWIARSNNHKIKNCIFNKNIALTGSGSSIWITNTLITIINNSFIENSSPVGAGCVYWEYFSGMISPIGLNSIENYFSNTNIALYGSNYATDGMSLFITTGYNYNIINYQTYIPKIQLLLKDVYNQTVITTNGQLSEVSVSSQYTTSLSCYDGSGYVSGGIYESIKYGTINFTTLQAFCAPGYQLGLNISLDYFTGLQSTPISLSKQIKLYFRNCNRGEYYNSKSCIMCPNGTYSLENNQNLTIKLCHNCPDHSKNCYGDKILVKSGYWRNHPDSSILQICPLGHYACIGGWGTNSELCEIGYYGPLCALCSNNYFKSSTGTCEKCSNKSILNDPLIIILLLITFIIIICIFCLFLLSTQSFSSIINNISTKFLNQISKIIQLFYSKSIINNNNNNNKDDINLFVLKLLQRLQGRIKIYLITYQIISSFPFVLDIIYPKIILSLLSSINLSNLSVASTFSFSCTIPSLDFVDILMIETLYPIFLLFILYIIYIIHTIYLMNYDSRKLSITTQELSSLFTPSLPSYTLPHQSYYIAIGICFLYLIFPGISTTIFRTFSCNNVDPNDVEDTDQEYMRSDYSISCHSPRYYFGCSWAIVMIFIYPIGIPLLFFYFLYPRRSDIMMRSIIISKQQQQQQRQQQNESISSDLTSQTSTIISTNPINLFPYRLLYGSYKPEYWYWEVIESYYRVMISGILVLIQQGSILQIIIGILFILFFFKLFHLFEPHHDPLIKVVKEISFWQLYFILFLSLLIKLNIFEKYDSIIITLFISTIFLNFIYEISRLLIIWIFNLDIALFMSITKQDNSFVKLRSSTIDELISSPLQNQSITGRSPHSISIQRKESFEVETVSNHKVTTLPNQILNQHHQNYNQSRK